ncbi:amidohydrolase family protein [Cloacibacillus sp. An23]|uniref:amidohydrolase family protein n=1 Tax=Cloacibacillus sp. An23 TaxID=1965591 RepID=UPI001302B0EC|nr:amidohydrolase family protein [Cloacibacillus sp. An23]
MIIDFHTHVFPNTLAHPAMLKLHEQSRVPYESEAKVEDLLSAMKEAGVDKSVLLHIATKESQHQHVLEFAKETNSEKLISFGSVMPGSVSALEYVWKISDEGLKGVKLHTPLQRIDADDERIFPVYDLIRALNLILVFHAGWDATYRDEMRCSPQMLLNILKNFPGIKIIAAHMGGLHMQNEVMEYLAGKADLYFDTAYTADPWIDRPTMEKMIRMHGAERVLFGSDFPWHKPLHELEFVDSLGLSSEEKELILGGNARRLLGI